MSGRREKEKDLDDLLADSRKLRAEMQTSMRNLRRFANRLQEQVDAFIEEERGPNGGIRQ
jgi:hypothetical protein